MTPMEKQVLAAAAREERDLQIQADFLFEVMHDENLKLTEHEFRVLNARRQGIEMKLRELRAEYLSATLRERK